MFRGGSSAIFIMAMTLAIFSIATARRKHGRHNDKKNDWDALDNLLRRIDRNEGNSITNAKPEISASGNTGTSKDGKDPKKNPCENHHCGWGKECIVMPGMKARCDCIRKCPKSTSADPFDKACSNTNETFESMCDLYRERCLCRRDDPECRNLEKNKQLHIEYLGACKPLEPCTQDHLEQFPARMADWLFQVMRDLKKRQELHGDKWLQMIDEAEIDDHLKHVYPVIWKFCDLDTKPHDKAVSHHELIPITAPVMPMESCIKPFLKGCDANADDKISLKEWGKCLGLNEEEIAERC